MKVCHFALRQMQVGDDVREVGDLVPEAASWPFVESYVREGQLGVCLVATLPPEARKMLDQWEEDQRIMAELLTEERQAPENNEAVEAPEGEDGGQAEGEQPEAENTQQPQPKTRQKVRN